MEEADFGMDAVHIGKETVISIHFEEKFSVVQFGHIDTFTFKGTAPGGRLFCDTGIGEE